MGWMVFCSVGEASHGRERCVLMTSNPNQTTCQKNSFEANRNTGGGGVMRPLIHRVQINVRQNSHQTRHDS